MTYKINGVELTTQPTTGRWLPREAIGVDGNGHPIYPPRYEFEMGWSIEDVPSFYEILADFDQVWITGSAVVDLPKYRSATWQFYSYSGCVLREPQFAKYFAEHPSQVKLLVTNIRA